MVRIKVIKLSTLIYYILVIILVISIIFSVVKLTDKTKDNESVPTFSADNADEYEFDEPNWFIRAWNFITGKKFKDPKNILVFEMPFIKGFDEVEEEKSITVSRGSDAKRDVPPDDYETEIILKNEPKISEEIEDKDAEEIKIKVSSIQPDEQPIPLTGEGPQVMIYHSHSRESYREPNMEGAVQTFYTVDTNKNVIKVGQVLSNELRKKGVPVLHDTTDHEVEGHSKGYELSLKTINRCKKENSSLKMFIDIHRDGFKENTRTPEQETIEIDGKRVAKVMVVIGTGKGQYSAFKDRPKWEENYKLALKLTNKLNEKYPGLAKPIYVRSGRYNQHVSTNAILIEVGSNVTTLEEAERAAVYIAEGISEIVE